jgi:hypothetical protein
VCFDSWLFSFKGVRFSSGLQLWLHDEYFAVHHRSHDKGSRLLDFLETHSIIQANQTAALEKINASLAGVDVRVQGLTAQVADHDEKIKVRTNL